MENENLKPVQTIPPFTKMIMTIGALPTSFYSSMSYYEAMVWLYEYLKNEVIPTVNNNGEAVEELQAKYIELKNYIDTYFDNLDVQEEVNKKLDEMAEDGTITNLIKGYIDPLYQAYETSINDEISSFKTLTNNKLLEQDGEILTFKNSVNQQITTIDAKVESSTSGSPLVATSVADMTDTTKTYVNTSDGKWYYYDGDSWEIGGTYQSTGIADNSVGTFQLSYEYKEDTNNLLDVANAHVGKQWSTADTTTAFTDTLQNQATWTAYPCVQVEPGETYKPLNTAGQEYTVNSVVYYDENGDYLNNGSVPVGTAFTIPADCHYVKMSANSSYGITQFKLYNASYTPTYEPYKYKTKVVLKDDLTPINTSLTNNTNDITKIKNIIRNWTDNTYITKVDGSAVSDQYSTPYSATDFIPVIGGKEICLRNVHIASNACVAGYDKYKNYIDAVTSGPDLVSNYDWTTDSDVEYIRVTCRTENKDSVQIYYSDLKHNDHDTRIDNIENNTNLKVNNLLMNNNKALATWIDDDTASTTAINNVKTICDNLEIKATFGCVTNTLENSSILTLLKSLQEEGFHITSHSHTHTRGTEEDPFWYPTEYTDVEKCEQDLIKSLVKLQENGFLDSKYFVIPGGNQNTNLLKMIAKWCPCSILADNQLNYLYGNGREKIHRLFIRPASQGGSTLEEYQAIIDDAYDNNEWIVFGTHSGIPEQWDATLITNVLSYAKTKGFEFQTFNQAWNNRKYNYDINDILK